MDRQICGNKVQEERLTPSLCCQYYFWLLLWLRVLTHCQYVSRELSLRLFTPYPDLQDDNDQTAWVPISRRRGLFDKSIITKEFPRVVGVVSRNSAHVISLFLHAMPVPCVLLLSLLLNRFKYQLYRWVICYNLCILTFFIVYQVYCHCIFIV